MNATDVFVDYLYDLSQDMPERVICQAKRCLLDYLGAVYAGAYENREMMLHYPVQSGRSTIIGADTKVDALSAAFINGYNAHTVELDDGHRFGAIHLGAVIISAVLAVAQEVQSTAENVFRGIVMGYEAAVRTAMAIQPGHKKRGYHTSGTCGSIGAAVGVAFALGYDKTQLKSVISGAATSAAGLLEIQEDASRMKPYNIGHAAMAGVQAAYIGGCGLCPPDDILGGKRGFCRTLSDTFFEERLTEKYDYYEIERIYVKPYAACRHCHPAIEAAIHIATTHALTVEQIERVDVYTYDLAVRGHDHQNIQGVTSAKLSMPYSVAAAMIRKNAGMEVYTEAEVQSADLCALTRRVFVTSEETFTSLCPQKRVSEVHVIADGNEYIHRVDYAKGEPENPLTDQEIQEKFKDLMKWAGHEKRMLDILSTIEATPFSTQRLFSIL